MPVDLHHPPRQCAYCGSKGPLTREHLWPASLHRRLVAANQSTSNLFWLRRIDKELQNEPTLRDVCKSCNNGVLSALDDHVCRLFDCYFVKILQRHETVSFDYDYHLLKRWLLKLSYNSARMHSSIDLFIYPALLPYINGHSLSGGGSVLLFVQLSYPGKVPVGHIDDVDPMETPEIWEPQECRCGYVVFELPEVGKKILRAIYLRSYTFFLAFFEPKEKSAARKYFSEIFVGAVSESALLLPSRPRIELVCNGIDAWQSLDGARNNKIVLA